MVHIGHFNVLAIMMRALFAGRVSHAYRPLPCGRSQLHRAPTRSLTARLSSTSAISSENVSPLESGHIELGDNEGLVFVNSEPATASF